MSAKNTTTNPNTTAKTPARKTVRRRTARSAPRFQLAPSATVEYLDDDEGGIDYGPAIEAVDDLLGWTFALARKDVAGWPEGMRRVRSAHRYVRAIVRGKAPHTEPREDLLFTAALLVRVFEADIGLGVEHIVAMLDQLGLPLDHVPSARPTPVAAGGTPSIPFGVELRLKQIYHALSSTEKAAAWEVAQRLSVPERDAWIAALMRLAPLDGARMVRAYLHGEIDAPEPTRTPGAVRVAHGAASCGGSPACVRRAA